MTEKPTNISDDGQIHHRGVINSVPFNAYVTEGCIGFEVPISYLEIDNEELLAV